MNIFRYESIGLLNIYVYKSLLTISVDILDDIKPTIIRCLAKLFIEEVHQNINTSIDSYINYCRLYIREDLVPCNTRSSIISIACKLSIYQDSNYLTSYMITHYMQVYHNQSHWWITLDDETLVDRTHFIQLYTAILSQVWCIILTR